MSTCQTSGGHFPVAAHSLLALVKASSGDIGDFLLNGTLTLASAFVVDQRDV